VSFADKEERKNFVINEIMICSMREKILARPFKI